MRRGSTSPPTEVTRDRPESSLYMYRDGDARGANGSAGVAGERGRAWEAPSKGLAPGGTTVRSFQLESDLLGVYQCWYYLPHILYQNQDRVWLIMGINRYCEYEKFKRLQFSPVGTTATSKYILRVVPFCTVLHGIICNFVRPSILFSFVPDMQYTVHHDGGVLVLY